MTVTSILTHPLALPLHADPADSKQNEAASSDVEMSASIAIPEVQPRREPLLCRWGFHQWLYLDPSLDELEEARQLISHGHGALWLADIGITREHVSDRTCRACHLGEKRFAHFLRGLRYARGAAESAKKG